MPRVLFIRNMLTWLNFTGKGAFAHDMSPNWQDASTQKQCDLFDAELGDPDILAKVTGSKAHHRFSGPQILRYRTKYPSHYEQTARISLVSSFLASVLLGKIAPIDISDVTGMNLYDIERGDWDEKLLALAADGSADDLKKKLGEVSKDGGKAFGTISKYFVERYGFSKECQIVPFTGDNPATILALPLRADDAMVSLGTSTTFLMSTKQVSDILSSSTAPTTDNPTVQTRSSLPLHEPPHNPRPLHVHALLQKRRSRPRTNPRQTQQLLLGRLGEIQLDSNFHLPPLPAEPRKRPHASRPLLPPS